MKKVLIAQATVLAVFLAGIMFGSFMAGHDPTTIAIGAMIGGALSALLGGSIVTVGVEK